MKPSVGRIVFYNSNGTMEASVVVKVFENSENNMINLRAFGDNSSNAAWHTSVSEGTESGQWMWPPRV